MKAAAIAKGADEGSLERRIEQLSKAEKKGEEGSGAKKRELVAALNIVKQKKMVTDLLMNANKKTVYVLITKQEEQSSASVQIENYRKAMTVE